MRTFDLQNIERKSWKLLQRDGLTDALFGVIFLAAAIVAILDRIAAPDWLRITTLVVIQFSGVGAMVWMRRRYVTPRLGRVKYSPRRVRRMRILRTILAVCVLLTVALVVLTALSDRLGFRIFGDIGGIGVWLFISAIVFVPIGGLAFFLDYPRLLIYAGLLSGAEFLHIVVNFPSRVPFGGAYAYGAASIIAFGIGVPIFVRFLRSTPRVEPEARGDSLEG